MFYTDWKADWLLDINNSIKSVKFKIQNP